MKVIITTSFENGNKLSAYFCGKCHTAVGRECDCHGKKGVDEIKHCPKCNELIEWPK